VNNDVLLNGYLKVAKDVSFNGNLFANGITADNIVTLNSTLIANGGIIATDVTANTFNALSDYRIKDNIKLLDKNFNIDNLKPVTYINKLTLKNDIGFLAHEVQEIFPLLVSGEKDGDIFQSINYIGIIPILVKELQELKYKIKSLENKIEILQSE
jgi:hypothetical protein